VKYPDLSSAKRSVSHTKELSAPNPPGYLNSSNNNSDSEEDQGQQEGDNINCDATLEESCPVSDHHLLTQ
jgi:hypothetical protein